jgi:hypothetical protein
MKNETLRYYLQKFRELPLGVALKKSVKKPIKFLAIKLEGLAARVLPQQLSDKKLLQGFDGLSNIEEALHVFKNYRPPFFIKSSAKDHLIVLLQNNFPGLKEEIVAQANKVCSHVFNLLGSGDVDLDKFVEECGGKKVCGYLPWHFDFKTGYKWNPRKFNKEIEIPRDKADIKVPWELSRFQHSVVLGQAYWLTEDEKYADEFVRQVNDWIDRNPPKLGVNWACTMDVAIRAVNWCWGYCFFKDSRAFTDDFLVKFLKSILVHGRHIMANLERGWNGVNSNHYLSDIVGLVYLGVMFPEFKEAKRWREFGVGELVNEMKKQVYPDGVDYEGSVSYHRLVTELFISATLLCLKNGIAFPDWYMKRLEKMIEFVMFYTKPDGSAPQIGDNDDGRLHILSNYGNWNRLDHRYLLSIGASFFDRADFKEASGGFHEEAFWLLGEAGLEKFNELSKQDCPVSSKAFPNGGFYVMRSDNLYMIVDCISVDPKSPSGHKHNSRLSFDLFAYDKNFIIDPGAYIYTADSNMRNLFRSTRYHNTVVVDDQEQNRFFESMLFTISRDAVVKINKWETFEEYDFLDAEHYGYRRLSDPVIHRRQIYFNKREGYWLIKDILDGKGLHKFDLYFHFAPMEIALDDEFPLVVKTMTDGANLAIIPLVTKGVSVEVLDGWVSFSYGTKDKAPVVKYSKKAQVPVCFSNVIFPYKGEIDVDTTKQGVQQRMSQI